MRRECPRCEREFKWLHAIHDQAPTQDQYYCPVCGVPAHSASWWTRRQLEAIEAAAIPMAVREIQKSLTSAFRSTRGVRFGPSDDVASAADSLLDEPDDMMIVVPPCHPDEPLKVPEDVSQPFFCRLCGAAFGV
jgi:hypothetical protein